MMRTLDLAVTLTLMLYLAIGWLFFTDLFSTFYVRPGNGQAAGFAFGLPVLLILPVLFSDKKSNLQIALFLKFAWIALVLFIFMTPEGIFRAYDPNRWGGRVTETQFRNDALIAYALNGLALPIAGLSLYLGIKRISKQKQQHQQDEIHNTELAALGSLMSPPKGMNIFQWYGMMLLWPVLLGGRDFFASMIIYGVITLVVWLSLIEPGRFGGMAGPSFLEVAGWLYVGFVVLAFFGQNLLKVRINQKFDKDQEEELMRQRAEKEKKEREAKIDARLSKLDSSVESPPTKTQNDTDLLDRLLE